MNLLKRIFSPTILSISFLLLIYTFYKSEIVWDGNKRSYYIIYYLISSILIFFSIITFFINQKIKEYLIIFGIILVVSFYLFEGYSTFKEQLSTEQPSKEQLLKEQLYEKQTGNKWDRRSKFEIYNDLKKTNNGIVVTIPTNHYINENQSIFAFSGISNSQTILCNENGYYSIYQSDRYGFNNPDNQWDEREIEYLLVGDSFALGQCVNRPNDISSVLRTLSNKSVLNLGQSGSGPLIEYTTLREYLNKNVKKVLWIYFEGNDLEDLVIEKKNNILINYLNDLNFTQNLKFKQNEIDDLAINFIKEVERKRESFNNKLIKFIKITNTRILILEALTLEPTPALEFKKILQLTKELTDKNNSKLYFLYLPEYNRYKINYDNTNENLVKKIVTELKISFIDIHKEVFEKEQNPLKLFPFELGGHYNIEGYKKIAETIYKLTKD
tara:strand:- start:577 stop:1899 length:1323 start_codon:yes stop_codon:yes gene_type:complete